MIGFAERIAGEHLRDLHHLFLIDDDAERLLQHRLDLRVHVFRRFLAELARAIGRDVRHRARTVERDERDDVLEPVGAHFDQRLAHARAFHLEHADRFAAPEHLEGLLVVERNGAELDLDAAPRDQPLRDAQRGQRLQAEEIEFHEAGRLDPFHVELRRRHVGLRVAVERHQFDQRTVADHDARGMGRGVGVAAPPAARRWRASSRLWGRSPRLLQLGLVGDRLFQRDGIGRVLRHQLGELVDLAERHFEHAPDIAQHAARQERAESDDLRDAILAIALAHVGDHLVAPLLAEVDVEVRHRHAFRVQEALEQQAEAEGIEIGDGQRPGDQRARARTAPRPDRNALRLRPFDEVGDDQEIAGKLHADDDGELEFEPLEIILFCVAGRGPVARQQPLEALARLAFQFLVLVDRSRRRGSRNAAGSAFASAGDRRSAARSRHCCRSPPADRRTRPSFPRGS